MYKISQDYFLLFSQTELLSIIYTKLKIIKLLRIVLLTFILKGSCRFYSFSFSWIIGVIKLHSKQQTVQI